MRYYDLFIASLAVSVVVWLPMPLWSVEFISPYNSQKLVEGQPLLNADETPVRFNKPAGFQVTLFAGEPDIRQPIAMTFDTRGRLWVAQNDTYAESKLNFDKRLRDAIIILSDDNGDGKHDKRTVFWDQGTCLTSIELGYGGVYALCPPQLLFIPDANGDDVPDGPVQVVLDGFDNGPVRHNIANGLKWGPDGWLYGRHGIQATSKVGVPGTPENGRVKVNCGIWRFHPVTKTFEAVADGTTNSWGMDWDKRGEGFFINTVIGHLWHIIPGAHFRRMYGEDLDRHIYAPIEQHADHVHWATGEKWNDTKTDKGTNATSLAGGGHAHSGMMIYQGANWPAEYRDFLYTINFHGRRLNREQLEREGSGYVGHHGADLLETSDVWFRGIELGSGPDGGVYMLDWSDIGECHDHDGVHRSSGRVFKIVAGTPTSLSPFDLRQASLAELVAYQTHADVWYARQARQVLQQRAAMGTDVSAARAPLLALIAGDDQVVRLRAMWTLAAIHGFDAAALLTLLGYADEHTRVWALRLLTDHWPIHNRASLPLVATVAPATLSAITNLAERETSALVRLSLASTLQRLPLIARPLIATALLSHASDADDHNLPLMLWYGVKDLAGTHDDALLTLAQISKTPLVRRFIARRAGENLATNPQVVERLLTHSVQSDDGKRVDVLLGLSDSLKGLRKVKAPSAWPAFSATLINHPDNQVQERLRDLGTLFGDGRALAESRRLALDKGADIAQRVAALRTVIENRPEDLRALCEKLIDDRDVNAVAAQGLGLFDDPAIADLLVNKYRKIFRGDAKIEVMAVLVSRPTFARVLLANLGDDAANIPKSDVTAFHARQIRGFNDKELTKQLTNVWGALRDSSEDKIKLIAQWKEKLTPAVLATADRSQGRMVFMQVCSACHKLYGSGGIIGPDLTGAGRDNLAYLVDNIADPSAVVGADFLMSLVSMKDGRILSGVVGGRTPASMTLQTMTERLTLVNDEVQSVQTSTASLMPEGLLLTLNEGQVRNLIAYLMHPQQVPLPEP